MIDWTKQTDDPVNPAVRASIRNFLLACRAQLPTTGTWAYEEFIASLCKGKRVLDIGICEHTAARMDSPKWKHRWLQGNASYCLGVDILNEHIERLRAQGLNVMCLDATSEANVGEQFDLVHIGDVIEHVNSPVQLLKFAERHLNHGGKVIVRTPNPFHYYYFWLVAKNGTDSSNLEHVSWISPTMAMEIGRRSGLSLSKYYVLSRQGKSWFRTFVKSLFPPEWWSTIYIYEFTKAGDFNIKS